MRQNRVVLNLNIRHLHLPCTSGVDRQVGNLPHHSDVVS